MNELIVAAIIFGMTVAAIALRYWWTRNVHVTIVHDYEKGLRYWRGQMTGVLGTGRYYSIRTISKIVTVDMRKSVIYVPAQEVFTRDKIQIKATVAGFYTVTDPVLARHISDYSNQELYALAQRILRERIARITLDELFEKRADIDAEIAAAMDARAAGLGLALADVAIRDIMIPAGLRKAYAGILEAQKDAQKKLEQARGEQAVLRNLANSSAMYDKNPMLLQARLIQALSAGTNSIVFNAEGGLTIAPKAARA